jgi:hypothetical protein
LKEIGKVLGTADAQPLDYWLAVPADKIVQLDDVVAVERELPDGRKVAIYGVVDTVIARHEGAKLESDVFLADQGILPLNHAVKAHVMVTRVEPEIFVPPLPGASVSKAEGEQRDQALFFDSMKKRFVLGLSRDREVIYGNFEFLDGSRGAHINISGVSGVATKTTYASFLLYGIFNSAGLLGAEKANTHALIFNVKGEDLLFLDKPNASIKPEVADLYEKLSLPVQPFESVGLYAPVRREQEKMIPDSGTRSDGVLAYAWTIEEFCKERYLRFLFADADDETSHLSAVIDRVENHLIHEDVSQCQDFEDLKALIESQLPQWAGNAAAGTQMSFLRRLEAGAARVGHLIRGKIEDPSRHRIDWKNKQITVVDIHNLHDRAKRFVIGVMLKRMFEDKEKTGTAQPLVFVVLDELNKYATRGLEPDKRRDSGYGGAGPEPRGDSDRRAADGQPDRAPGRRELVIPRGRQVGYGGGATWGVWFSSSLHTPAGQHFETRHDDRFSTGDSDSAARTVSISRVGHETFGSGYDDDCRFGNRGPIREIQVNEIPAHRRLAHWQDTVWPLPVR